MFIIISLYLIIITFLLKHQQEERGVDHSLWSRHTSLENSSH